MLNLNDRVMICTPGEWADKQTGTVTGVRAGQNFDYGVTLDNDTNEWGYRERELLKMPPLPLVTKHDVLPEVTRVEVIDDHGRAFTLYGASGIEIHTQDEGRTIKIFVNKIGV